MGSYSRFRLETQQPKTPSLTEHEEAIAKLANYGNFFEECEEVKWYDYDSVMTSYSKGYPNIIFKLYINNEDDNEGGSLVYYLNGKSQAVQAKITFPDFDSSKLIS